MLPIWAILGIAAVAASLLEDKKETTQKKADEPAPKKKADEPATKKKAEENKPDENKSE